MRNISVAVLALLLSACATWSTSNVRTADSSGTAVASIKKHQEPESILLTEGDIADRKYKVLGEVEVTVNKTTIFHKDPTREMVNEELKKKAAEISADAVILVRYGTVGVSLMSWGSLNGKGRAIAFVE